MLVKYAYFVKIQPTAPDKRVRPKASNLLVDLIEPLSLKEKENKKIVTFRILKKKKKKKKHRNLPSAKKRKD